MRSGVMTNLLDVQEDARHLRFEPTTDIMAVNVQRAIEMALEIAQATAARIANVVTVTGTPFIPTAEMDIILVSLAAPAVINLPLAITRGGKALIIKDISGHASTNNITIGRATGDAFGIDGLVSVVIATDMGGYSLTPVAGGWIITP
jgi:hypothetical protein